MKKSDKKQSDLSLSGLTMPDFDSEEMRMRVKEFKEGEKRYKKMYGDEWQTKYMHDLGILRDIDYDEDMQHINECIYIGIKPSVSGVRCAYITELWEKRMHELYGNKYDELCLHCDEDIRVKDLLLNDAIKTGKWKELPVRLQSEYHERVGDINEE